MAARRCRTAPSLSSRASSRIIVTELSFVTENDGGLYCVVSGGIAIGWGNGGGAGEIGLRFQRLRFKIGGNSSAPPFLLDGASLSIKVGTFALVGYFMYRNQLVDSGAPAERRIEEFGGGLTVAFELSGTGIWRRIAICCQCALRVRHARTRAASCGIVKGLVT